MTDSIWADVLDKMYDLVIAESTIATEIAAGRLKVFDGPPINDFSEDTILTIGGLPINDDSVDMSSTWDWAALGRDGTNADVDDLISVPCAVHTVLGEPNLRTARRTAITIFQKAAAFYRGSTLTLGQVMWLIPQIASLRQDYTADGAECLITFFVHVRTRI